MLRNTKWKLEKAKVKVVFRLQFHATNIPQSGWEKLYISFIPTESGKIIAKTSKANVRNGTCKWADPIYETTRLLVDSRNKRYDDNLYKLVVGMGTSRSSILGEAIINLADYADASNPSVIALPLHGSDDGTILHVTIQLLTAKTGFREFEQQFDKGLQNSSNLNREVEPSNATSSSSSELQISDDHGNKVNTKTHFGSESKELISAVEETGIHEEFSDSPIGCDGSSNTSETYYADKIDSSNIHEPNMASRDLNGPPHGQSPTTENVERFDHQGSSSDYPMNNDLAIAHEENHRLRGILEMAESSIFELKMELNALNSYANEMGTETQKIAHHLTSEISSGQKLERDIMVLRSECLKFKNELQQLKEIKSSSEFIGRTQDRAECQQLKWANGLLLVEDRIRELQGKIHIGFHEPDSSFIHSDLEVLLGIVQDLENGTIEAFPLQNEIQEFQSTRGFDLVDGKSLMLLSSQLDEAKAERENLVRKMNEMECYYEALVQELEENQKQILGEFQSLRYEHSTCAYAISTCKSEAESLRHNMNDQVIRFTKERHALGCVNEELEKRVQELEENQERILGEFRSLKNEHSTCADTITTCKAETESVRRDMNDRISKFANERRDLWCVNEEHEKRVTTAESLVQELRENRERILGEFRSLKNEHLTCADTISTCKSENESIRLEFAKERHTLGCLNEELEKRVTTAESALKRARLNYSIAVTQLQKDLDTLSFQVSSMFETNQTLIKDTFSESSKPLRYPNIVENVQTSDDTLVLCEKPLLGGGVHSDDKLCEISCANLYLDVYSGILEETLRSKLTISEVNREKQDFLMPILPLEETTICEKLEMEIIRVVLKATLNEHYDEYIMLRDKCSELMNKLSEQVLKTEEFKNLVKLKECEKRDPEGPSESLRIAFMKERCETTVQELKQELFVSKRHGEEILLKLQDVLDETESRKKSEAAYLKKIEEFSIKIAGLEAELQSIKAELECALLNLECCKEEKEKIVASMKECEEEKLKIAFELSLFHEHFSRKDEKGMGVNSSTNRNASIKQIFELEGMKTENSILSVTSSGSSFQDLQRKLSQLHKANEELGGMYPNFKDFSGDGNALERVLALEIELAETLMAKKNSSIQFQSSFVKQHGDEEAIFKSFRDINEVIKETLEMKSKYANVDTELKEMQERYSRLSLQFAEVEGERQKLMMTIKNSRSPTNPVSETLNDSYF